VETGPIAPGTLVRDFGANAQVSAIKQQVTGGASAPLTISGNAWILIRDRVLCKQEFFASV
jgi:hypothetical protein